MESNPPRLQSPEQMVWSSEGRGSTNHVRSYECTFCKRGFSNAQALGGHMNIHRKDRAKLKQSSRDRNQLGLDTTKKSPSCCPIPTVFKLETESAAGERTCTLRLPWVIPRDQDDSIHKREIQQLPLFIDSLMGSTDDRVRPAVSHGYVGQEVDLELRLGPDPQELSLRGHKEFP